MRIYDRGLLFYFSQPDIPITVITGDEMMHSSSIATRTIWLYCKLFRSHFNFVQFKMLSKINILHMNIMHMYWTRSTCTPFMATYMHRHALRLQPHACMHSVYGHMHACTPFTATCMHSVYGHMHACMHALQSTMTVASAEVGMSGLPKARRLWEAPFVSLWMFLSLAKF